MPAPVAVGLFETARVSSKSPTPANTDAGSAFRDHLARNEKPEAKADEAASAKPAVQKPAAKRSKQAKAGKARAGQAAKGKKEADRTEVEAEEAKGTEAGADAGDVGDAEEVAKATAPDKEASQANPVDGSKTAVNVVVVPPQQTAPETGDSKDVESNDAPVARRLPSVQAVGKRGAPDDVEDGSGKDEDDVAPDAAGHSGIQKDLKLPEPPARAVKAKANVVGRETSLPATDALPATPGEESLKKAPVERGASRTAMASGDEGTATGATPAAKVDDGGMEVAAASPESPVIAFDLPVPSHAPAHAAASVAAPAQAAPEARFAEVNHPNIVSDVRASLLPRGGTMQIRLDPPELGALQVTVEMRDGTVNATFQTSNDDATRLLSHSLGQLKSALESQGVNVDRIQVQQAPRDQQARNGEGQPQQQENQQSQQEAQREQQRRETLRRMWRRIAGTDSVDLVA